MHAVSATHQSAIRLGAASAGRTAGVSALVLIAGCAQTPPAVDVPVRSGEPAMSRSLDGAYDPARWRWVRNRDGRALLSHTQLKMCFVDPAPEQDFAGPGFSIKREARTIGITRYEVVTVFEQRQFWQAGYARAGSTTPILGVYSAGKCQEEAERILQRLDNNQPK